MTRFSRNERAVANATRSAADDAVPTLLAFVNHAARPWASTLPWVCEWRVRGEAPTEPNLDELHGQLSSDLHRVSKGTFRLSVLEPLRVFYTFDKTGVHTFPPQDDLYEYLRWALLHVLAENRARHLKRCATCGAYFLAQRSRARFCSPACQDAHFNAQRQAKAHRAKLQRVYGPRHPRQPRKS